MPAPVLKSTHAGVRAVRWYEVTNPFQLVSWAARCVLSSANAKKSDVYLLRGSNPVVAYHLDAQNPTRLIVADAMQLRPNDILYVAEKPIASFNRALVTIAPLRILLRDIQDENIP